MRVVQGSADAALIRSSVRGFIVSHFMPGDPLHALRDDDLLFEGGIVDSAGAIALIAFLEEEYGIQVRISSPRTSPRSRRLRATSRGA